MSSRNTAKLNLVPRLRHTKKPFYATPRSPAKNPLSVSDQQETSKVTICSSTSVPDITPLPVPTHVIDRVHALAGADDQNPNLDFFTAWVILSHMATTPTTTINTTPEISQEWNNITTKWKSQDWQHQTKRTSHEWQHQKRKKKFQRWTHQNKKMRKRRL